VATLEELARGRAWIARILTAYGLDPTSKLTLTAACQAHQVSQAELSRHLETVWNGPEGLNRLGPQQLIEHIIHCHHRYLRRQLPRLLAQAHCLAQRNLRYSKLHSELRELNSLSNPHMFREELEVFPAILDLYGHSQRVPHLPRWIQRQEQEHGRALQHFLNFRQTLAATDHDPEAVPLMAELAELDEDMRWHMYAENDLLFARCRLSA
jgi:iron-sulfur cluster repair protein YtfE (RIC family)